MGFDHFFGHEPDALGPLCLRWRTYIDSEVDLELVWVVCSEFLKLFMQQDVVHCSVSEKHRVLDAILVAQ